MNKKSKQNKHTKIFLFLLLVFIIFFFISTQFLLPVKNSQGTLIVRNIYIVTSEIFFILFFFILTIIDFTGKISFLNILKNAILIPITIISLVLLNVFSNLNLLMIITIPLSGVILYIILSMI
jgi:hypothetical protein